MSHNKNDIFANRGDGLFVAYVGMETDLIFTQGIDLPGFASFPLLSSDAGRATLSKYFQDQIALAEVHDVGVILESPTWVANRDRGAASSTRPGLTTYRFGYRDVAIAIGAPKSHRSDFGLRRRVILGFHPSALAVGFAVRDVVVDTAGTSRLAVGPRPRQRIL